MDGLPGLTVGLAVLQSVIAVGHAAFGAPAERPFVVLDGGSAAIALVLRMALGRGAIRARWAHPLAAACALSASAIVLLHLRLLADPLQSLMLILVLIGAGSILLWLPWLNLVAALSLIGWLGVMYSLGFPPGTRRIGVALVGSWALGAAILSARLHTFRRLEELWKQHEWRLVSEVAEAHGRAQTLRRSEEQHRLLFEKSPLPMWVLARESLQFLAVNEAAIRTYGYSQAQFLERTLPDLVHPDDLPQLFEGLAKREAEQGAPIQRRHRRSDGTVMDVEVVAHPTAFDEWEAILTIVTDITERRKAQEEVQRSRESFQQLFEEAPVGMAIIARGTSFVNVNKALCEMLGYSRQELVGASFQGFVVPEDLAVHVEAARTFVEEDRESFRTEARYRRRDGGPLWGSLRVERIQDSNGRKLFVLVMLEDVSARRRAAEERERSIQELRTALANVKTLRGLIPICASCKKIRDDTGYWSQVEVYVREHSEAEFSHGICPPCMMKLYGR